MMFYMLLFHIFAPVTTMMLTTHTHIQPSTHLHDTGAFLVPYILMVFVIGLPMFLSELFVGQYSGLGPNRAYEYLAPFFHGKYTK